ncbi:glycosyltransferase family 2 protein [Endozoicomonas sp. Mp262]|uniref:glycosyltransferase family 2 protein n=1 Tax=Endozoicomonas sp. Mp262 TaxID=2919499 RepID=UPI0021D8DB3F
MSFNPCAIIPVYNHHRQLPQVIQSLHNHQLHCILVDDGSAPETREILESLVAGKDYLSLYRLSWNQGKGAAVMEGLMRAQEAGFSHAVQVDADGQHDCGALPALLAEAESHPHALISGLPEYDNSAPKSRLYGRMITRFWVWIETLSRDIHDAMVGFRVYPLDSTCGLIRTVDLTRRMDFDIEIVVRLHWAGIKVRPVPVSILYPEDGLSHFDAFKDNVRISLLHARLCFGMLRRLPALLKRNITKGDSRHWSHIQERGSELGIRFLLGTYRLLGHKAFGMMLWPVMLYFFLTGRTARKASTEYLERLYRVYPEAFARRPDWRLSFQHFLSFGHSLAERFGSWLGKIPLSQLDIEGQAELDEKLSQGQGVVMLVSHHGNVELCRALTQFKKTGPKLRVNVLVHTHHAPMFNKLLGEINPDVAVRLIQVSEIGPDTSMMLSEMIEQGEIVAIAADRLPEGDKDACIEADFLGEKARFPRGPFILASLLKAPVFTLSCTRSGNSRFSLVIAPFADSLRLPRKERLQRLQAVVQDYAHTLEEACRRSPLEWFNFFDFWKKH